MILFPVSALLIYVAFLRLAVSVGIYLKHRKEGFASIIDCKEGLILHFGE